MTTSHSKFPARLALAMLGLLQLLLWIELQRNRAILWSVAMAFSAAAIAFIELTLMYAETPDEYGALLIWSNWAVFGLLVSLISGFISIFFRDPFLTGLWSELKMPVLGKVGTPLLFDTGVYTVVIGVTLLIIFSLSEE